MQNEKIIGLWGLFFPELVFLIDYHLLFFVEIFVMEILPSDIFLSCLSL